MVVSSGGSGIKVNGVVVVVVVPVVEVVFR